MTNFSRWIEEGERLLAVRFDEQFCTTLVDSCFDSVWVVQEACFRACEQQGVFFEQDAPVVVGTGVDVPNLIEEVVSSQSDRFNGFLEHFPGGFQSAPTELEMYKWLLLPVLSLPTARLEQGLLVSELRDLVNTYHPRAPLNDEFPASSASHLKSTSAAESQADHPRL